MKMMYRTAVAVVVTSAVASALAAQTTPAITPADLKTRLYVFADDSMRGREAGTEDNLRGTAYIERELRRLGLTPAGDSGTSFFQNVPLVRRGMEPNAAIAVGGRAFVPGRDFLARDNGATQRTFDGATAVAGGTFGDDRSYPSADSTAGRIVIVRVARGWQVNRLQLSSRYPRAAAIAVAAFDLMPPPVRAAIAESAVAMADSVVVPNATSDSTPAFLYVTRPMADAMLGHVVRGHAAWGTQVAPARNVVAIVPGSDPALRGQYVALGAHNDHVGYSHKPVDHDSLRAVLTVSQPMGADSPERPLTPAERRRVRVLTDSLHRAHGGARPDSIFNGADDDGSGSMGLLEIAEYLAAMPVKPKRSTLLVWHTGEELGLYGSIWYTDHPTVPRDSIVAQLNIDMIGRGGASDMPNGGPGYVQLIGSRRLSTELGNLVEHVNKDTRAGLTFDYQFDANGHPDQYYCRSDHYEYARYGIPIVFFSTGSHRDYHQVTDEPQYIDYTHYARVTSFVRDLALRIADLDHRIVVDHRKPDPRAECVQ